MRDKVADNSPLLELPLMNHIDLFSGIGGFALAARTVWGKDYRNLFFCDNNKFCAEVLKKNFGKDVLIYEDIRTATRERFIADTRIQKSNGLSNIKWKENTTIGCGGNRAIADSDIGEARPGDESEPKTAKQQKPGTDNSVDLLTGGFPCQPFSQAGRRRGTEDDRFLWPEMLRVIKEFKPTWIIGENVAGFLSMAQFEGDASMASETDLFGNKTSSESKTGRGILYGIIEQLREIGYAVQVFLIPAVAVNAPHRRDRVWIVGNNDKYGFKGKKQKISNGKQDSIATRNNVINSNSETKRSKLSGNSRSGGARLPDSNWDANWLEVAAEFCGVDDEFPDWVDKYMETESGYKITKAGHRVERLKALGNAIVPQVAVEIMRGIKMVETGND